MNIKWVIIVLFLCLCFTFCKKKNESIETVEMETIIDGDYSDFELFNLDSISNFQELAFEVNQNSCDSKLSLIFFDYDNSNYKFIPMFNCPFDIFDYYLRDVVYLTNDSIYVNYKNRYSIHHLNLVMENHLINRSNDPLHPPVPNTGFFNIYLNEDVSKNNIKIFFREILETYKLLNKKYSDTLNLQLYLSEFEPPIELMKSE